MTRTAFTPARLVLSGLAIGLLINFSAAQPPGSRLTQPQLVLLDGQTVNIQSLTIVGGKLSGEGVPADLSIDDLRRIELPVPPGSSAAEKPAVVVELRAGGRVLAKNVSLANDKCQIEWASGEPLAIPIDAVRAVRFEPGTASTELDQALAAPSAELDRLLLKVEAGKLDTVSGLVESISADEVKFELDGRSRPVPRAKLFAIVVAQPDAGGTVPPALVILKDGSQLGGELTGLVEGKASLQIAGGGKAEIPWAGVRRVLIRSSRVAFLSDLKPAAVEQQAIATIARPWQRDKSVLGKPLALGSRVFEKGIGVHSRSLLTFDAEGKYDVLAAAIGIDAETAGKGDCVFTVLGDGQPLFTRQMKGSDAALDISVPIAGMQQVTLLIEPGADLDLADHADWCDVRFIKNKE
jgi:hypothetical protein